MERFSVVITEHDADRLRRLIATQRGQPHSELLDRLTAKLDDALIVKATEIPADVITMYTRTRIHHLDGARSADYTVVLPDDTDTEANRISILAPLGSAVIGQREGDEVHWPTPGGGLRLRVEKILNQPEAVRGSQRHWPPQHRMLNGPERSVARVWDSRQLGRKSQPEKPKSVA